MRADAGATEGPGAVTAASRPSPERRDHNRQRTRLRSGKLVGGEGGFLCECLVRNRSVSGCRLRLSSPALKVPPTLFFYDDQTELLFRARLIWRTEREIGLRLLPCVSNALHRSILGAMRRRSYIVEP